MRTQLSKDVSGVSLTCIGAVCRRWDPEQIDSRILDWLGAACLPPLDRDAAFDCRFKVQGWVRSGFAQLYHDVQRGEELGQRLCGSD